MAGITPEIETLLDSVATDYQIVWRAGLEEQAWRDRPPSYAGPRMFAPEDLEYLSRHPDFDEQYTAARRCYPNDAIMVERLELLHDGRSELYQSGWEYLSGGNDPARIDAALVEVNRLLCHVRRRAADLVNTAEKPADVVLSGAPPKPVKLLIGKDEICDAVHRTTESWEYIRTLSKRTNGPVKTSQGAHAVAEQSALVSWWNEQAEQKLSRDEEQRKTDRELAENFGDGASHPFGKEGTVFTEIDGGLKTRRPDWKGFQKKHPKTS